MIKDLFFLYYIICYSAGILALFLSMYLYFVVRAILLKKYIRLMALFFVFISAGAKSKMDLTGRIQHYNRSQQK